MDAILDLLDYYNLEDPAAGLAVGEFANPDLQTLYDQLTLQGSADLNAALSVGATIEDLDINDLAVALTNTSRQNITTVYESLQCGSRNHLRAFTSQLESRGGSYSPQYISPTLYDEIIDG